MKILTARSVGGIHMQAASYELSFDQNAIPYIRLRSCNELGAQNLPLTAHSSAFLVKIAKARSFMIAGEAQNVKLGAASSRAQIIY